MRKVINLIKGNWQAFIKFSFTGFGGVITNLVIFYVLVDIMSNNAFISSVFCYFFASTQNYLINFYWTFSSGSVGCKPSFIGLFKFYLSSIFGLIVNLAVLAVMKDMFDMTTSSQLIGLLSGVFVNFAAARYFVFYHENR